MTIEAEADIRRKEAVEWFARLNQRKVTTADVRGFSAWRRDPANAHAFQKIEAMWDAAGALAGDTRVTALGTRFDVRRSGAGARVILVDGQVAVRHDMDRPAQWSLTPGQQVVTSARQPRVMTTDVAAATSWTVGRLTFENTPISVAVAEVNRYSLEPIEVQDARVSEIRVSGVFNAGDIDGFVAALTDLYPLQASRSDDGRIVLSRGA